MSVKGRDQEIPSEIPMIMKGTRQEVWTQLEDTGMNQSQGEYGNAHGAVPKGPNDTTREESNIFVWKDIDERVGMFLSSPRGIDASMWPQTTGIAADGPLTVSSGIDAASLSDSSVGSEILESLPSSPDGLGHDILQNGWGTPMLRAIMEKAVAAPPTTEFRGEICTKADPDEILTEKHKRLQYKEMGLGTK